MNTRKNLISILVAFVFMAFCIDVSAQSACSGNQIFTSPACAGDQASPDEQAMLQLVNKYRAANKLTELKLSAPLSMLANRRMLDLKENMKTLTHSWSNCPYNLAAENTWPCVIDAPERFKTGYQGQGYETLYHTATGNVNPRLVLEGWQKSTLHNSIILNLGMFKDIAWNEVGVAIDGPYAALWFGHPGSGLQASNQVGVGLGVSYDQAVAGLSKTFHLSQASSTIEDNKWQGFSADKKIKLELYGSRKDISEAALGIWVKLDGGRLGPQSQAAVSTLLGNLFPEWPDHDAWVAAAVTDLARDRTVTKTKIVRKINIDLTADGAAAIKLTIRPESKKAAVEVY